MRRTIILALLLLLSAGCGNRATAPSPDGFAPLDGAVALFWDRQTTESGRLLQTIGEEFNAGWKGLPIKIERSGRYDEIFRKVTASIQARKLPAMTVAYESMTAEYVPTGAVVPLDDFVSSFSAEDRADFFPAVLESNRFEDYGGKYYSFPYTKSVLMMFYNQRVLDAAGVTKIPETWDEFLEACRAVKAKTGKFAYAASVDCSTIDGMIFSRGGDIARGRETLFDAPASIRAFEFLETLKKEGLVYQITPGTFDDEQALVNDEIAFTIRTSSARAGVEFNMGDLSRWGMARLPQEDPSRPATVLFGANVTLFKVGAAQQEAALAFLKHFTSTENCVRWAIQSGYLPIRKSAADHPDMQAFWAAGKSNRASFDCLPFARVEPNVSGWQEVRKAVEDAETQVLTGLKSGRDAALELKKTADAILARHAQK
jgi:multiple sugar transport system substrate-binding protein